MSRAMRRLEPSVSALARLLQGLEHDFLDAATERPLIIRAKAGDHEALEELLRHNEKLIYKIARRFFKAGICGNNELVDLQQYGRMGFVKAVERFDLDSGNRLSTYATWWIRQAVSRMGISSGSEIGISFRDNEIRAKLLKARSLLENKLMRECTFAELAAYSGEREDVVTWLLTLKFADFDAPGTDDMMDNVIVRTLRDPSIDVEAETLERATVVEISQLITKLPATWKRVLEMRYGMNGWEPQSYQKIADELHITKQRVDQIEESALKTLRSFLTGNKKSR